MNIGSTTTSSSTTRTRNEAATTAATATTPRTKAATRIIKYSLNKLTIQRRRKQPTHTHTKQNNNKKKKKNNNNNKPARHQILSPKLHFVEYLHRTSTRALPRPRRLASAGWSDHSKQLLWIASTAWGMRHPFQQFLKHIWRVMSRVHLPHPSALRKKEKKQTNICVYIYIYKWSTASPTDRSGVLAWLVIIQERLMNKIQEKQNSWDGYSTQACVGVYTINCLTVVCQSKVSS